MKFKKINIKQIEDFKDSLISEFNLNNSFINKRRDDWILLYESNFIPDFLKSESFITYIDSQQGMGKSYLIENLLKNHLHKKNKKIDSKFDEIIILDAMEIMHLTNWKRTLSDTVYTLYKNEPSKFGNKIRSVSKFLGKVILNVAIEHDPTKLAKSSQEVLAKTKEQQNQKDYVELKAEIINFNKDILETNKPKLLVIDNLERITNRRMENLIENILYYRQLKGMIILFAIDKNEFNDLTTSTYLNNIWEKIIKGKFYVLEPTITSFLKEKNMIDDSFDFDEEFLLALETISSMEKMKRSKKLSIRSLMNLFDALGDEEVNILKNLLKKINTVFSAFPFKDFLISLVIINYFYSKSTNQEIFSLLNKDFLNATKWDSDFQTKIVEYINKKLVIDRGYGIAFPYDSYSVEELDFLENNTTFGYEGYYNENYDGYSKIVDVFDERSGRMLINPLFPYQEINRKYGITSGKIGISIDDSLVMFNSIIYFSDIRHFKLDSL